MEDQGQGYPLFSPTEVDDYLYDEPYLTKMAIKYHPVMYCISIDLISESTTRM